MAVGSVDYECGAGGSGGGAGVGGGGIGGVRGAWSVVVILLGVGVSQRQDCESDDDKLQRNHVGASIVKFVLGSCGVLMSDSGSGRRGT